MMPRTRPTTRPDADQVRHRGGPAKQKAPSSRTKFRQYFPDDAGRNRITIEVTPHDIARSKRGDSYNCILAHAIARIIPDATRIGVDTQAIRFTHAGKRFTYLTPPVAAGYVAAFDAGDSMYPFRFRLNDQSRIVVPVRVRRKVRTHAGRLAQQAVNRAKARVRRRMADKPPEQSQAAAAKAAQTAYAAVREQHPDEPFKQSDRGGRPPIPLVFKRKHRLYGGRLLRVNQPNRHSEPTANAAVS
jgi:hypothetical protein